MQKHRRPRKNYLPTGKRVKISTYKNKFKEMPESDDLQKHRVYTEAQKNHGEVESEVAV